MRVNVYSQEIDLDSNPQVVMQKGTDRNGKDATFYGIRFYLHSASMLHQTEEDDDRSAVTFWVPSSREHRQDLAELFKEAYELIREVIMPVT